MLLSEVLQGYKSSFHDPTLGSVRVWVDKRHLIPRWIASRTTEYKDESNVPINILTFPK